VLKREQADDLRTEDFERIVDLALAEDLRYGDATTQALITAGAKCRAYLVARSDGIVAGLKIAGFVFNRVDGDLKFKELVKDGDGVHPGNRLAVIEGNAAGILSAERTALNFLQRLSGIATETAKYVEKVSGTKAYITDTRKTTPGLRVLEKYAVRMGGGHNHRRHLGDGILIKDNHLAVLGAVGISVAAAVKRAVQNAPNDLKVEVEVEYPGQAEEALSAGADVIMLDNMSLDKIKKAVKLVKGQAQMEASGGIDMDNVRAVAETGVDFISIGALTHSIRALDISLEVET